MPARSPLTPRPRPRWRTDVNAPQIGSMAEDLLGVALVAAAGGSGTVGRPLIDKGIDLYLRRLRTLRMVPLQAKASIVVGPDGTATHFVPEADLRMLSNGFVAIVHIPAPHDQLYQRIFLVPDDEFRKRCPLVAHHGIPCYQFTAQFAGEVDREWAPFTVELDKLRQWVAGLPGWQEPPGPPTAELSETIVKAETKDLAAIGSLWAEAELERSALGRLALIEDRIRLDTVTLIAHDLLTQEFAGVHLRTAVITKAGRIHFEVKRPHFFVDPDLWVLVVFLKQDLRVYEDFVLLIPSADISALGFSETLTIDPLTKRFRTYLVPTEEFGKAFLETAFSKKAGKSKPASWVNLRKAS
jgi:hypothetical protein